MPDSVNIFRFIGDSKPEAPELVDACVVLRGACRDLWQRNPLTASRNRYRKNPAALRCPKVLLHSAPSCGDALVFSCELLLLLNIKSPANSSQGINYRLKRRSNCSEPFTIATAHNLLGMLAEGTDSIVRGALPLQ